MSKFKKHSTDTIFTDALVETPSTHEASSGVRGLEINALEWTVYNQIDGEFDVSLLKFRDGSEKLGFVGRPRLIAELAPEIRIWSQSKAKATVKKRVGFLVPFFRFLSSFEAQWGRAISHCMELDAAHGEAFKRYLLQQPTGVHRKQETMRAVEAVLNASRIRLLHDAEEARALIFWPTIESTNAPVMHQDVNPKALKVFYSAMKRAHDEARNVHLKGAASLKRGSDPRLAERNYGSTSDHWGKTENLSVLARIRIANRVLLFSDISKDDAARMNRFANELPNAQPFALYRQHAPLVIDALVGYMLVSFHTGWTDTVGSISVVDDNFEDCDDWYIERSSPSDIDRSDIQNDRNQAVTILANTGQSSNFDRVVDIKAVRPKTGRLHAAQSVKNSRYRPFAVLKNQIEATSYLRDLLRKLRQKYLASMTTGKKRSRDLFEIERKLRSPWIYFNKNGKGHKAVGLIGVTEPVAGSFRRYLTPAALELAQRRGKCQLFDDIERITSSDIRDGFANYVFEASGGNPFVTQHLMQHQSIRTTAHYLRQGQHVQRRLRAFREMCRLLFEAIEKGREVDPTALNMAMSPTGFTDQDYNSLQEFRSRFGMVCVNPTNPPPDIAPNHVSGTLCASQRCVLCCHGRLTAEAVPYLARRLAELLELARVIPTQRFLESSLDIERQAIQIVREETYPELADVFDKTLAEHRLALKAGHCKIFDEMPLSHVSAEFENEALEDWGEV